MYVNGNDVPLLLQTDSYLACAKYMRYCYAKNILLDLTGFSFHGSRERSVTVTMSRRVLYVAEVCCSCSLH